MNFKKELSTRQDIEDFVRGCTLFGTGGGGTPESGIESLVSELEAMELEDKGYKFLKIDTYKNRLISDRYDIEEIPTVLKLESGKVSSKLVNPDKKEIVEII